MFSFQLYSVLPHQTQRIVLPKDRHIKYIENVSIAVDGRKTSIQLNSTIPQMVSKDIYIVINCTTTNSKIITLITKNAIYNDTNFPIQTNDLIFYISCYSYNI